MRCGTRASKVTQSNGSYTVELEGGHQVTAEKLLVATGRKPRVEGIGLETVDVTVERRRRASRSTTS